MTHPITTAVVHYPVTERVSDNLERLISLLGHAQEDSLVVTPEGGVSGYAPDPSLLLERINWNEIKDALSTVREVAVKRKLHLFAGSYLYEGGNWYNATFYFGPKGEEYRYKKVNLAFNEQRYLQAGRELPVFRLSVRGIELPVAVQMCREIRYPEQWLYLARQGAKVFVFLNNAVGDAKMSPVWRSHLVSRAAETQRYVISANNAADDQKCPTIIISPSGEVLLEKSSSTDYFGDTVIDLGAVSNWALDQSRSDLVAVTGLF